LVGFVFANRYPLRKLVLEAKNRLIDLSSDLASRMDVVGNKREGKNPNPIPESQHKSVGHIANHLPFNKGGKWHKNLA